MKTSTRVLFSVYIILIVLLCVFLLLSVCNVISSDYLVLSVKTMLYGAVEYQIIYVVVFCAFIVTGICLLFFGKKHTQPSVLIKTFENGKILISYDTIMQLTQHFIRDCDAVSEDKIYICIKNNQVFITASIQVDENSSIPAVTSSLHDGIIEHINAHTGVVINDCKIIVSQLKKDVHIMK